MTAQKITATVRLAALGAVLALASACSGSGGGAADALLDPSALRPPAVHSVLGTIWAIGADGEAPVSGALVELTNGVQSRQATTDEQGGYQFLGVAAGRWRIAVQKDGYAAASEEIDVETTIQKDFLLEPMDEQ